MRMRAAVRVSALPVTALEDLRFHRSWELIQQVTSTRRANAARGERLADHLYDLIGTPKMADLKPRLVALRRAIHGGRALRSHYWNDAVRSSLGADLSAEITEWEYDRRRSDDLAQTLPEIVEGERETTLERMMAWLSRPAFQYGLVQGSAPLFEELTKWRREGRAGAPTRPTVDRLAKYLARAVAKTSPYSTFMVSGLVDVRPGAGALLEPTGDFAWSSVAELNVWLLRRFTDAVTDDDATFERLRVRLNPSLVDDSVEEAERLRFLSPGRNQSPAAVRRSAGLDTCLEFVRQRGDATVGALVAHLRTLDTGLPPQQVREYVRRLVSSGVLYSLTPYADQDHAPLEHLADWLDAAQGDGGVEHAAALRELRHDLRTYPTLTDPDERGRASQDITSRIGHVIKRVEDNSDSAPLPRKNLFYENAVFVKPVARCASDPWEPILADLSTVRDVLTSLDPLLPARQALGVYFAATYGADAQVPWFDFYQDVNAFTAAGAAESRGGVDGDLLGRLAAGPTMSSPAAWWDLPFAREQATRTDTATELVLDTTPDAQGAVRLAPHTLADAVAAPTPIAKDVVSCYLQLLDSDRGPSAVLNNVTSGYGRGLSRLARLEEQAGASGFAERAPRPRRRAEDGALLLETGGAFGSNLNLRTPGAHHHLDVPYVTSHEPHDRSIPLNDLIVGLDAGSGCVELRSRSRGERLRPFHGGLMAVFWMPAPIRHLIEVFGASHTLLHSGVPLFVPRRGDPAAPGVREMPRVEVGSIVLARRCWVFGAAELPRRGKGEDPTRFWLRLAAWLAEHEIPERFFVRSVSLAGASWRPDMKSRKPVYIDVAVQYLLTWLERVAEENNELIVITETLPDLGEAPRYGTDRHVTELLVELEDCGD